MGCAYCAREGPYSREHIFPEFLYKLNPGTTFGFNRAAGKFHNWEAVVRDVCRTCNNQYLSQLDSYAKQFYTVNNCGRFFDKDSAITLQYDYHLLLRWLLKVSYNAARVYGGDSSSHKRFIPYILRDKKRSGTKYVELYVEVVRNCLVKPSERCYLPAEMRDAQSLPPSMLRIGTCMMRNHGSAQKLVRFFAMNAYFFYIVLPSQNADGTRGRAAIDGLLEASDRIVRVRPNAKGVRVHVSKRDALDVYRDQALNLAEEWWKYLASGAMATTANSGLRRNGDHMPP